MSEHEYLSMWERCQLEGRQLDLAVKIVLGLYSTQQYSTDWEVGGPLIESNQISLDPPFVAHMNYGNGRGEWVKQNMWTATVSAAVRTKPNPNDPSLPRVVGRGSGPTPLIAAMRAIVDSFEKVEKPKS